MQFGKLNTLALPAINLNLYKEKEMERVKWYRNASEKDQDNVKGRGTLMAIMPMQNNSGGSAVIADDEGNIVEKELSLIKIDKEPQINTEALEAELSRSIEANGKLCDDLNALQTDLTALQNNNRKIVDENVKFVAEVKDLKAQQVITNKKDAGKSTAIKPVKK